MFRSTAASNGVEVNIAGDFTIYRAAELWQALRGVLAEVKGGGLSLDLSDVTEMDAAGLQMLLALARYGRNRGTHVSLSGRSQAVDQVLELARLERVFDPAPTAATECRS